MYVGACHMTMLVASSHSLKDKRAVARRLKARVTERFNVTLVEVDAHDLLQRLELGFAVAASEHPFLDRIIDAITTFVASVDGLELVNVLRSVDRFAGAAARIPLATDALTAALDQTGAGDKAAATADTSADAWVPDAWRDAEPA